MGACPMALPLSNILYLLDTAVFYFYDHNGRRVDDSPESYDVPFEILSSRIDQVGSNTAYWVLPQTKKLLEKLVVALEKGVQLFIMSSDDVAILDGLGSDLLTGKYVITVDDAHADLITLATKWRSSLQAEFIGIAGSSAKHTTKEVLRSILKKAEANVYIPQHRIRTVEDAALSVLSVSKTHTAAVIEVNVTHVGHMEEYTSLLKPTMGILTHAAHIHLNNFESLQEYTHELRKLFAHLSPSQIGMICGDIPLFSDCAYHHPVVRFGLKSKNQLYLKKPRPTTSEDGKPIAPAELVLYKWHKRITLPSNHHSVWYASLAAAALSYFLYIPEDVIAVGIEEYVPVAGNFQCRSLNLSNGQVRGMIINDINHTHPEAVKLSLMAFDMIKASGSKIAVIGDMDDMGDKAVFWHRQIGRVFNNINSINHLILVGELAHYISETTPFVIEVDRVETWNEARDLLAKYAEQEERSVLITSGSQTKLSELIVSFS